MRHDLNACRRVDGSRDVIYIRVRGESDLRIRRGGNRINFDRDRDGSDTGGSLSHYIGPNRKTRNRSSRNKRNRYAICSRSCSSKLLLAKNIDSVTNGSGIGARIVFRLRLAVRNVMYILKCPLM